MTLARPGCADAGRSKIGVENWGQITILKRDSIAIFGCNRFSVAARSRFLSSSSLSPLIRYWNNGQQEVDFVVQEGDALEAFLKATPAARPLLIGSGGVPLDLWFE